MAKTFTKLKKDIGQDDRVTFGKYAGNTWFWVMENYPDYIIWCVGNTDTVFGYDLIVSAIKSKYKRKAEAAKRAVQEDYPEEEYIPPSGAYSMPKPLSSSRTAASFYTGGLRGDMAHFSATQQQEAADSSAPWDDDVPF